MTSHLFLALIARLFPALVARWRGRADTVAGLAPASARRGALPWMIASIAVIAFAVQTVRIEGLGPFRGLNDRISGLVEDVSAVTRQRESAIAAHQVTKDAYRAAQRSAIALEQARIARVTREQKDINDATAQDHRRDLDQLRARAERLRRQIPTGAGADSSSGAGDLPSVLAAASGASEGAGHPRLPSEQLERDLIASEQALQLEQLIAWVRAQAAIDPNPAITVPEL